LDMDDLSIIAVKRALLDHHKFVSSNELPKLPLPPVTPPKKYAVERELNDVLSKVST